ncbi:unnamed protein product, partial [Staurois parvus]
MVCLCRFILVYNFYNPPILAFRQPPNLSNKLISRKLPNNGSKPCNKKRSKLQPNQSIKKRQTLKRDLQYLRITQLHLQSCVYLIQCRKCSKGSYVGETGQ